MSESKNLPYPVISGYIISDKKLLELLIG
jgi:hypothetical protein